MVQNLVVIDQSRSLYPLRMVDGIQARIRDSTRWMEKCTAELLARSGWFLLAIFYSLGARPAPITICGDSLAMVVIISLIATV